MDKKELATRLGSVDLFTGLRPAVLTRIVESGHVVEHPGGAEIVSAGEPVSGFRAFSPKGVEMHVVLSGHAVVRVNGQEVGTLPPGAYFGELSLIDGQPRSADIIAGPDGLSTFALPKWSFDEMLHDHPEVAVPMLRVVTARLRRAEAKQA
jgi:CRP/FNR family transcriptional regulator, cyclic AMP receptor protein